MTALFTVAEVARITGVPASTIRRWITEGRLTTTSSRPRRLDYEQVMVTREATTNAQHATRWHAPTCADTRCEQ